MPSQVFHQQPNWGCQFCWSCQKYWSHSSLPWLPFWSSSVTLGKGISQITQLKPDFLAKCWGIGTAELLKNCVSVIITNSVLLKMFFTINCNIVFNLEFNSSKCILLYFTCYILKISTMFAIKKNAKTRIDNFRNII